MAQIVRSCLREHGLAVRGTAYFDPELESLTSFYEKDRSKRRYFVIEEDGLIIGGAGLAAFDGFDDCAELQKLYLVPQSRGKGLGKMLLDLVEKTASQLGYRRIYLETHSDLKDAIRLYERNGYEKIKTPDGVLHTTMDCFYLKQLSS